MFSGFRTNLQSLLTIGGIYLIASLLALLATGLVDGGLLVEVMTGNRRIDGSLADDPRFTFAMLTGVTLSTPVMMAYWFAPLLAGWHHLPAPKRCSSASWPASATGDRCWSIRWDCSSSAGCSPACWWAVEPALADAPGRSPRCPCRW